MLKSKIIFIIKKSRTSNTFLCFMLYLVLQQLPMYSYCLIKYGQDKLLSKTYEIQQDLMEQGETLLLLLLFISRKD